MHKILSRTQLRLAIRDAKGNPRAGTVGQIRTSIELLITWPLESGANIDKCIAFDDERACSVARVQDRCCDSSAQGPGERLEVLSTNNGAGEDGKGERKE